MTFCRKQIIIGNKRRERRNIENIVLLETKRRERRFTIHWEGQTVRNDVSLETNRQERHFIKNEPLETSFDVQRNVGNVFLLDTKCHESCFIFKCIFYLFYFI